MIAASELSVHPKKVVSKGIPPSFRFRNSTSLPRFTGFSQIFNLFLGWWFQIFVIFTPKLGEDSHFDYFYRWVQTTNSIFFPSPQRKKTCMKFSRISGRGLVMTKEAGDFISRKGGIFLAGDETN